MWLFKENAKKNTPTLLEEIFKINSTILHACAQRFRFGEHGVFLGFILTLFFWDKKIWCDFGLRGPHYAA